MWGKLNIGKHSEHFFVRNGETKGKGEGGGGGVL